METTYKYWNELLGDNEIFKVEYNIEKGEPEIRRGHPDNWREASATELEIVSVTDESGNDRLKEMDDETFTDIESDCWLEFQQELIDYQNGLYI